jgi:predicted nucleic acid-binding protein
VSFRAPLAATQTHITADDRASGTHHVRANLSACDASYVALAEQLGCQLLTVDARLARAPGIRCPIVVL